ncbi:hypothetical protein R1sor_018790 [Riccia sorocarpa]|uniref:CCHC-type domain-containing protein n=1 Tax=Riccia sorocarpa TaxID=122646 RepID=A0ABD3IAR6_9MARC
MASTSNQAALARGGKTYQGPKVVSGAGNVQARSQGQGQIAQLRPAGAPLAQKQPEASPTKNPMDYKAAVSPAKGPGSYSNVSGFPGTQYPGPMIPFNMEYGNAAFADDENYGDHNEEFYQGQTQDVDEADEENPGDPFPQNHPNSPLHDIQESDEEEHDTEAEEEECNDPSFIDRHNAWVNVLDENLQKTRKNPACKEASVDFKIEMSDLLSAVEDIIETTDHEGKVATEVLQLDSRLFAEGIKQLQQNSFIVHTVDLMVNMAYFERWAEVTLHQLLGVKVVSMCQLDPYCFHVVVDSGKAKTHVFANSPLKMGNKMVFPMPWDTRFNTKDLKSRAVPVWLQLYNVHPGLIKFGLNMLRKVGPIIYAAKNTETQWINIVRGGILMDLSKPLPDFIPIMVPEAPGKIMQQRIRYLRFPDACFLCRQRGHFARSCPLNNGREDHPRGGQRTMSPQQHPNSRAEVRPGGKGKPSTPEGEAENSGARNASTVDPTVNA